MQIDRVEKDHEGMCYRLMVRTPEKGRKIIRFQVARLVQGRISWWTIPSSSRKLQRLVDHLFCNELKAHSD